MNELNNQSQITENQPVGSNEFYAMGLIIDEITIAIEELKVQVVALNKAMDDNILTVNALMQILLEKNLINTEELKQILTNFKNANYGVTH
jgi:hypothetical protein